MLTDKKKDFFKTLLTEQLSELLLNVSEAIKERESLSIKHSDPSDQAAANLTKNFKLFLRERERQTIREIITALGKIENSTYGRCERCKKEINENRLKIQPVATLCIHCKKKLEAGEKQLACGLA